MTEAYRPGLENVIACETEISFLDVDHEEIVLRGYDLIDLAKKVSYIDIIGLLIDKRLPNEEERKGIERALKAHQQVPLNIWTILKQLPSTTHPMDMLRTGVSALSGFDPDLGDQSPEANRNRAIRLLAQVPQIVAASHHIAQGREPFAPREDLSFVANGLYMITGREPSADEVRYFDQVLMVYCEHELPNSTFAARVITSTLSDMYGALTGAVASLKGPLHGGANEAVMEMLLEAKTVDGFEQLIRAKLANKEKIMGFGQAGALPHDGSQLDEGRLVLPRLVQPARFHQGGHLRRRLLAHGSPKSPPHHHALQKRVARQSIGAVYTGARRFAERKQPWDRRPPGEIGLDATHQEVSPWRHRDRPQCRI